MMLLFKERAKRCFPGSKQFSFQGVNNVGSAPVRVSFLTIRPTTSNNAEIVDNDILVNGDIPPLHRSLEQRDRYNDSPTHSDSEALTSCDRICFNVGRELYVFVYR